MPDKPPVPADCDLRGLEYMPLFGNHLFGSEFNAAATDSEWRAALTLWWAAWNQVPAGSLPSDDIALCRLADLGRDVKGWKKLRARALHGFELHSDGRLYHAFLCEQALVAWDKRVKERERKAKWRAEQDAKKAGQNADVPRDKHGTETGTSPSQNADVPADGNRRDGTGRDGTGRDDIEKKEKGAPTADARAAELAEASAAESGFAPGRGAEVRLALRRLGIMANPADPRLDALLDLGATVDEFVSVAADARDKRDPWAYVLGTVKGRRDDAAGITANGRRGALPQQETAGQRAARQRVEAAVPGLAAKPTAQPTTTTAEVIDVPARRLG